MRPYCRTRRLWSGQDPYSRLISWKLKYVAAPRITWSMTSMPSSVPAATRRCRDGHIVAARRRIARRMIVEQDDRRRAGGDGFPEDIARSRGAGIERADGHDAHRQEDDVSCRAARCRTARPARRHTAAAATRRPRCGCENWRRSSDAESVRRPSSTAARIWARARHARRHRRAADRQATAVTAREDRRHDASTAAPRSSAVRPAPPWPRITAISSLSPSAVTPARASFSRGRSAGASRFTAGARAPAAPSPQWLGRHG